MTARRTHTTKDINTLRGLVQSNQLVLSTEFQRNAVWPRAAKAYLMDTILCDRPIPYLYFRRAVSAQSGKTIYEVIDGQQRIRAVLEFMDDAFSLIESKNKAFKGKKFSELNAQQREQVLTYDLYVEELTGYSDADIVDMFLRMNRFVVKLSPQEIRHAKYKGAFKAFVEKLASGPFWKKQRVFSEGQAARMRTEEFIAELTVLVLEGPQDKKAVLDLYYGQYEKTFPYESKVEAELNRILNWIAASLPNFSRSRWRRPTDLYALIGALHRVSQGRQLKSIDAQAVDTALKTLEGMIGKKDPPRRAAEYKVAASRQTDNLAPRLTRIDVIEGAIRSA